MKPRGSPKPKPPVPVSASKKAAAPLSATAPATVQPPLRVLLGDDHAIFRRGLIQILSEHFREIVFGEAETAQQVLELVWKEPWDIVVLDLSMPGRSGTEVIGDLLAARPKLPVLVVSAYPEEQYALRILKVGAAGYLTKIRAPHELITAVEKVVGGGRYVTAALAEKLALNLSAGAEKAPHERLSDREFEVMRRIALGQSVKEIAGELCVSMQTISTHRARLLKKMGLRGNAELMRYALEQKLVE
jgi:two-component system invasion response regulator UvrY